MTLEGKNCCVFAETFYIKSDNKSLVAFYLFTFLSYRQPFSSYIKRHILQNTPYVLGNYAEKVTPHIGESSKSFDDFPTCCQDKHFEQLFLYIQPPPDLSVRVIREKLLLLLH